MPNLASLVRSAASAGVAATKYVAETVVAIDDVNALRELKEVRYFEPVWMRKNSVEAETMYLTSATLKWAGNVALLYGALEHLGYAPNPTSFSMPHLALFALSTYAMGILFHLAGNEGLDESRQAASQALGRILKPQR